MQHSTSIICLDHITVMIITAMFTITKYNKLSRMYKKLIHRMVLFLSVGDGCKNYGNFADKSSFINIFSVYHKTLIGLPPNPVLLMLGGGAPLRR